MVLRKSIDSFESNTKLDKLASLKDILRMNLLEIFEIDHISKLESFEEFIVNTDHGFEHSLNVYKKALEISDLMKHKGYSIDVQKIFIMSFMHDSGRFHMNSLNPKKRKKCESNHHLCAVGQLRLARNRLSKRGIAYDETFWNDIFDYLKNHDFINSRLDPFYKEPSNLEGQIVRLSDRISTDIETEIDRYWETGKRLNTPYFINETSFEDRINFDFTKIGEYIKTGKFDEFTFFLGLISITENDYDNHDLRLIYKNWASSKQAGINRILAIGKNEGYSDQDLEKMKNLIYDYMRHFNITF